MTRRHTSEETAAAIRLALSAYPTETYASLARKLDVDDSTVRRIAEASGLEGLRGFAHTPERRQLRGLTSTAPVLPVRRARTAAGTVGDGQGQFDFSDL